MWAWVPTEVLIARGYKIFDAGESSLIQIKAPQRNRAVTVLLLLVVVKCALARHLGRRLWRGGGYGEVGARDPSAKTRDRMIEYVGEAMDE